MKKLLCNSTFLFVAVIIAGVLARAPLLYRHGHDLNMDEAVIGIMALDILKGHVPLFFYGQIYFGPFEAMWPALVFTFAGVSILALRSAVLLMTFSAILIFWLGAKRFFGRNGAVAGVAWLAVSPSAFWTWSILPSGQMAGVFIGCLLFYVTAVIVSHENPPYRYWSGFGLVVGFGLWTHPGALIYVVPSVLVILVKHYRAIASPKLAVTLGGVLAGGFPFWLETFKRHADTFSFSGGYTQDFPVRRFLEHMLGSVGAMGAFFGYDQLPTYASWFALFSIIALVMAGVLLWLWRMAPRATQSLGFAFGLMVVGLTFCAYSYVIMDKGWGVNYRYYMPLVMGMAVMFGYLVSACRGLARKLAIALVIVLTLSNATADAISFQSRAYLRYDTRLDAGYMEWKKLAPTLKALGVKRVYADMRNCAPITFTSKGDIICVAEYDSRFKNLSLQVSASGSPAFVMKGAASIKNFTEALRAMGAGFSFVETSGYGVFYNIKPPDAIFYPVDKRGMKVTLNPATAPGAYLVDGNMATFWSTEANQTGDEWAMLDIGKPVGLARVDILPRWHPNFPARISIETSTDARHWRVVDKGPTADTLGWAGPRPFFRLYGGIHQFVFAARQARYVRIRQTGQSRVHMHICEINLFTARPANYDKASPADWGEVMLFLKREGIERIVSDFYFSANVITRSSGAVSANIRHNARFADDPLSDPDFDIGQVPALAVYDRDMPSMKSFLAREGMEYQVKDFGPYHVVYNLSSAVSRLAPIPRDGWRISASHNAEAGGMMLDGDMNTVWRSGVAKKPGMSLELDLGKPATFSAVRLDYGRDRQDAPAGLEILVSDDGISWRKTGSARKIYRRMRWVGGGPAGDDMPVTWFFKSITARYLKVVLQDNHKVYNWSVRELDVLG